MLKPKLKLLKIVTCFCNNTLSSTSICKLSDSDRNFDYLGQTSRNFKLRFKGHIKCKDRNIFSNLAKYIYAVQ